MVRVGYTNGSGGSAGTTSWNVSASDCTMGDIYVVGVWSYARSGGYSVSSRSGCTLLSQPSGVAYLYLELVKATSTTISIGCKASQAVAYGCAAI